MTSPFWHPCTQMKDHEWFKPLSVKSAKGSYLKLSDGRTIIDATSSWWCKSLGHQHPRLKAVLFAQANQFEHVMLANTTNEATIALSEQLTAYFEQLKKVCYASDGASVIEMALKMSLHTRVINHEFNRHQFIALKNAYHGETIGALSVSDLQQYKAPYQKLLFNTHYISTIPYVKSIDDPLWDDCETIWQAVEFNLKPYENSATALILEPILQGGGGMQIYSKDFLKRLRNWTRKNNIHLIADEIMTGIGRTGKMFACDYAAIEPDFLCLSKGLTSGYLPFSALLTTNEIYNLFYDDYEKGKSFLHSHTFSGFALAARIAREVLNIMEEDHVLEHVNQLQVVMRNAMEEIANQTGFLKNIRGIGAVVAADIDSEIPRCGIQLAKITADLGALIRPLGNTLYWLPPLNTNFETIEELKIMTGKAITLIQSLPNVQSTIEHSAAP